MTSYQPLTKIFEAQRDLIAQFHKIELANGFPIESAIPVDLDNKFDQFRLKELAWRITEEIGETITTLREVGKSNTTYQEEVSDVIHFFVEMLIIAGITPSDLAPGPDQLESLFMSVLLEFWKDSDRSDLEKCWLNTIVELSLACNELKNRPWKQSFKPTDREAFKDRLVGAFHEMVMACIRSEIDATVFSAIYFRKHEINQGRANRGV